MNGMTLTQAMAERLGVVVIFLACCVGAFVDSATGAVFVLLGYLIIRDANNGCWA